MPENLEKAFELATSLVSISNQKRVLLEELEQSLLYFYNGGTFKIDKDLISFLSVLKSLNNETCVLLDSNKLPIEIEDVTTFLMSIIDQYSRATNSYFTRYQELKNNRNLESILDL